MRAGFSLVELSIVLVILGLLTGGILTGQNLIRAAELRAVSTEYNQYVTALHTFQDKYFALPGDMRNATDFWGAEPAANCPGTSATPSTGTATCNGDGNGIVDMTTAATIGNEKFRFWQHLANAGLIEGNYTGVGGSVGPGDANIRENVPSSKADNVGWSYSTSRIDGYGGGANSWSGGDSNQTRPHFVLGGDPGGDQLTWLHNAFTADEAWNIDTKLDDGKPGLGYVRVLFATNCSDTNNVATAVYQLDTTNRCSMLMLWK